MIAKSFRSVGWVASVGAAALGCYMVSLKVAAERAELSSIERRIVGTQQAIRNLQTELGTRGRMQQLEQWNADVLALSAPVSGQFVANEVQLASLQSGGRTQIDDAGEVQLASAEAPAPAASPAQPQVRVAAARTPEAQPAPRAEAQPMLRRASLSTVPAARPAAAPAPAPRAAAAKPATPAPVRAAAAAAPAPARAASLLDERTTRALREAARAERPGGEGERPRAAAARASRNRGE